MLTLKRVLAEFYINSQRTLLKRPFFKERQLLKQYKNLFSSDFRFKLCQNMEF